MHSPLTYGALPDIDNTAPLEEDDRVCIAEIRDVLERHGKLDRFGLTLLHQHFHLADDEVLVETCDLEKRELTIRPISRKHQDVRYSIETSWRLSDGDVASRCMRTCVTNVRGGHKKLHNGEPI